MAHANEALIRSGYEAFARGDIDTVLGIFDEDICWHISGRSPISGDYRGHAEVVGFFSKLHELSGGTFGLDVHDVLANDDHVVALVADHAQRDGKSLNTQEAHIWHVSDGKATEFWSAPTDQGAVDEFWA